LILSLCYISNTFANGDNHQLSTKKTILIFDNIQNIDTQDHDAKLPKKYRHGLSLQPQLYASASAQPNKPDLQYIINQAKINLPKAKSPNIVIIDLRQEPHAFLNGLAVSWYGFRNQIAYQLEPQLIDKLQQQKTVRVYKGIDKLQDGYFIPKGFSNITISDLQTEQQVVEQLGANYFRLKVTDHHAPDNAEVDLFVEFIKRLPKNSWLHFHCRGGKGRSTTFMAMYDMILHAKKLSLEDILARQQQLGGAKLDKNKYLTERQKWKEPAIANRYQFIQKFYQYVLDPSGYNKNSWNNWHSMQN
jgi:protein-tyrosine phosphatase